MTDDWKDAPPIPGALAALATIPEDLAWNWNREARAMYRTISPSLWHATAYNPLELLRQVSRERLETLVHDEAFLAHFRSVCDELSDLSEGRETWFSRTYPSGADVSVAYFCAEFGLHHSVPIYSGGLGILAGDHCKAAADLGVPLVAVGLMYKRGYFDQRLRDDGWQEDSDARFDPAVAPVARLLVDGNEALASVKLSDREIHIGAWKVKVGRVPVILLDTDLEVNDPGDRDLSARLYAGGDEHRLQQEWVLGVGGVRVLRRLGIHPGAWHANEGHAAFMFLERTRELLDDGRDLEGAIEDVRSHSTFTTHTPVPAGHDAFDRSMIEGAAGPIWEQLGLNPEQFFDLGRHPDHENTDELHMTALGIRMSERVNGVAKLHGAVSRDMWRGLFAGTETDDVPIGHVTNGVHSPTWMASKMRDLMEQHLGAFWERRAADNAMWDEVLHLSGSSLWDVHMALKAMLLDFIRESARARFRDDHADGARLVGAGTFLATGPLTIGFARRFATYKRADLIFRDADRLRALLTNPSRPVQLIFAGKAHPADDPGKQVLQRVYEFAKDPTFEGRIAFLEDYSIHMARRLVSGVDVWLNMPVVPMEACGTSGMKAALNGVPQLGTSDGWWAEGFTGQNGWRLTPPPDGADVDAFDHGELFRLLEEEVVPRYYDRDSRGMPRRWVDTTRHAIREAGTHFTAGRMVMDYMQDYYAPSLGLSD